MAVDFDRQGVGPGDKIICNIELGQITGIFRETDIFPINPEVEERVDSVEIDEYTLAVPTLRNLKRTTIRAHLVSRFKSHPVLWRFTHDPESPVARLEFCKPRHSDIDV